MSTMAYCLEEAAIHHKRVVVLDRPNPVSGDLIEGNVLEDDCRSFVGLYALPMRHGMTLGELALFINSQLPLAAELTIIPMEGWQRRFFYPETGLPWVYPSPNLPSFASALVYPGQVIWEGTNISEGRGTTLPFELWGAPFIKHKRIMAALTADDLPGCLLRPVFFEPLANKWAAETCAGFQIHVTNRLEFSPYHVSLALLRAVMTTCGDNFKFKKPPYEYEFERLPLDLILGSKRLRQGLAAGRPLAELEDEWQPGLNRFKEKRQEFLLYK
jgi:uncharacterized protein YbbC (DUF1343 family)